ncbi:MAG: Flagellar biosynthesis protein FlhA [Syntrophorhabdus sp. PtaB.Bin184]|jgi:flagellar biosynthesis protein FlhA|nr:MAG: Flagellar biosynthesis protein FlhA [Syntrophorhabdus sp. PtaB.Bin184]
MARSILKPYLVDGILNIHILEKTLEERLLGSIQPTDQGAVLALDLGFSQKLIEKIGTEAKKAMLQSYQPVILVHPLLRGRLRRFLDRYIQGITVISHNEIPPQIRIQSVGVIRINEG